jgi:hypothetical protein
MKERPDDLLPIPMNRVFQVTGVKALLRLVHLYTQLLDDGTPGIAGGEGGQYPELLAEGQATVLLPVGVGVGSLRLRLQLEQDIAHHNDVEAAGQIWGVLELSRLRGHGFSRCEAPEVMPRPGRRVRLFGSDPRPGLASSVVSSLNWPTRDWYTHAAPFSCSSTAIFSTAAVTAGA